MHTCQVLPEGYREYYSVDLQKNKKTALFVNVLSVVLALLVGIPMHFHYPIWHLFDMSDGFGPYLTRTAVLFFSIFAYICLHELTHAAVMRYYGAKKVRFGFTGLYAYAGSLDDYFAKVPYIHTALAPVIVWGVVFIVLSLILKGSWLWIAYFLQILNVSGAAGDLFVAVKFSRFPSDIFVRDTGIGMTVYSREEPANEL